MPTFDFKCPCNKVKEIRVNKYDDKVFCSCEKGLPMDKMVCSPSIVGMDNLGRSGNKDD